MNDKVYKFEFDIIKEYGKGRVKVIATFDDVTYEGSIVNMGLKFVTL